MDTNLKKSKLVKAFIYRIIMVAAFITMIASGIFGREALINVVQEDFKTITGDIYYLTEFREYMASMFQDYMIGRVGVADDLGYPLTADGALRYESECLDNFNQSLANTPDAIIFQYQKLSDYEYGKFYTSNIDAPLFSENDGHLLENNNFRIAVYWNGPQGQLHFFGKTYHVPSPGSEYLTETDYTPAWEAASEARFVLGYREAELSKYGIFQNMYETIEGYQSVLILFITSAVLFVFFGILSLFTYRRFHQALNIYSLYSRKVIFELKLILIACCVFVFLLFRLNYTLADLPWRFTIYPSLWLYYPLTAVLYLLWLDFRYAPIPCLANSIIYKTICGVKDLAGSIPWKRKIQRSYLVLFFSMLVTICVMLFVIYQLSYYSYPILVGALIFLVILLIFQCSALIRLHRFVQDTNAILDKIDDLSQGVNYRGMRLSPKTLLSHYALTLEDLQSGIEMAVEQENKANRMRVELITNVSHDLKTPLTSIINYADLLSEEELAAPASEYVEALRDKAYRLKKMVQDVFELSKATTGNLPVEMNKLDMAKLIRQTLADMDEELQSSTLSFILKISSEPLFIMADGEKMYRVFQNLLVNAMQYSLSGSRVHIVLDEIDGFAVAQIKNISKEEINFTPDEIVERFVRADSSRTKDGSGLGLSIVQSFTQACGGEFSISLDADLFTACIRFPLISEEEGITDEETIEDI